MTRIALLFTLLLLGIIPARAGSGVLIVTGLTGSSENDEEFQHLSGEIKKLAVERGFPAASVETLSEKVTRADVLDHLKARAASSAAGDEFWLILLGHSGRSTGGVPAFQVSGPRLTAADLKQSLDAIQGKQFVFIATNESGPFLPLLQDPRRTILSATKSEGESDQPRYPEMWVNAFGEKPHAPLTWIAARAAELTDHEYSSSQLAQTEHSRLADPVTGRILEPPFGANLAAPPETASIPQPSSNLMDASDIKVEMKDPEAEWEQQPATEETKKLIAAARALPNPDGHSALMMEQRIGYTVEEDRTTDSMTFFRVFIAREDAVEEWANRYLPQSPPAVTTRLDVARIIRPDGSSVVFNPAKLGRGSSPDSADPSGMVFLPDAHAGCLIELGYHTREMLDATLPEVSADFPVQQEIPVFKTTLEVRVPQKQTFHILLNNSKASAAETTDNGRHVYHWDLGPIAALEHLDADPPVSTWSVWLGISSLPSWDEFAQWFRRLAAGSDAIDPTVQKAARELSAGAKSRMEKIQRTFEFVSALRYVAIEMGVQGFRPHTPAEVLANRYGDCKDKANLIVALLACQDIDAHLVLLDRGGYTDVNFPSWQFNHAIAFVPKAQDQPQDLWLDSTDSVTPFGFVAPGDFGRSGLVFSKDKAEFKTIASEEGSISTLSDDWNLTLDATNGWTGHFQRHATGMAEDAVRRIFRGLTPLQRKARIYDMAAGLYPQGDFADASVSDVSSLHEAIDLGARLRAGGQSLPDLALPLFDVFAAPDRDRPVLLNDGQPLAATQTIHLSYPQVAPDPHFDSYNASIAGEKFSLSWKRIDTHTIERTASVEFAQPSISTDDYSAVRRALLAWKAAIAHDTLQLTHP